MANNGKALLQRVNDLERRIEQLEKRAQSGTFSKEMPDLRAFVESCDPSSHTERALAIGYYHDLLSQNGSFTVEDVKQGYRTCREPEPGNPSDVVGRAGERGWLMKDGKEEGLQCWRVTTDGESEIEASTATSTQTS